MRVPRGKTGVWGFVARRVARAGVRARHLGGIKRHFKKLQSVRLLVRPLNFCETGIIERLCAGAPKFQTHVC